MQKGIKIAHIIEDEKFIPYCKLTFSNECFLNTYSDSSNLSKTLKSRNFDAIIVHYLNKLNARAILNQQTDIPLIWFFWGQDGFNLAKFHGIFLMPETKKLRVKTAFESGILTGLKWITKDRLPFLSTFFGEDRLLLKAIRKFHTIVPVVPGDYDLLKSKYPKYVSANMFHMNYVSPPTQKINDDSTQPHNILLGNSASYSNNHIEIIERLSKLHLADRKVVIPLSYGDKDYASFIYDFALKKLGKNAMPLLDFMPYNDYLKLIKSCEFVIMNHTRQQAMGNIMQALLNGSHIFLNRESNVYEFLTEEGFKVSSIEGLKELHSLAHEDKKRNKQLFEEVFGKEHQHKRVVQLITNLSKNN